MQISHFLRAEAGGEPERGHLGGVQHLVRVGIADPGDELLVSQHALDLGPAARQYPGQNLGSKAWIQRFGAERRYTRDLLKISDEIDGQALPGPCLGQVEARTVSEPHPEGQGAFTRSDWP